MIPWDHSKKKFFIDMKGFPRNTAEKKVNILLFVWGEKIFLKCINLFVCTAIEYLRTSRWTLPFGDG